MIVSGLFRSATTHFCHELAQKLNLTFLDEIYDPLNDDILRLKRVNHEFKGVLKGLDKGRFFDLESKIDLWKDHSQYLINNHNYDVPWFEAANIFYCRKDLLGALHSIYDLIVKSGQPVENIWIYADWMRRFVEYVLVARGARPLVLAENCNYLFRSSGENTPEHIKKIYRKKININLENKFTKLIESQHMKLEDVVTYVKKSN